MFRKTFLTGCLLLAAISCWCQNITLATFNIRRPGDKSPHSWRERLGRCLKIVRENKIDIYGIQEAYSYQVKDLLDNGKFQYTGGGRNDFKNKGEFCAILYKKDRFTLLDKGIFGLSEKPHIPNYRSWRSAYPRIAVWGLFQDKKTQKKFLCYNTHLDHVRELARINGIKLIVEHAKKNAKDIPLVLCGDFNAKTNTPTWKCASMLLKDSRSISKTAPTGPVYTYHGYGKSKNTSPIDFIFVSKDFTVLSHKVCDTKFPEGFASDHYPVISVLALK